MGNNLYLKNKCDVNKSLHQGYRIQNEYLKFSSQDSEIFQGKELALYAAGPFDLWHCVWFQSIARV